MKCLILISFTVFCVWLTDPLVDMQFEEPGYTKAEVAAMNELVERVTSDDWLSKLERTL
jgi:hypothetical protein